MKARRIGYARVSTKDQTLERQIKLLIEAGVSKDNIYLEKVTGRTLDRTKWKELLADLIVGDTLIVTELDRLGRNKKDILATFELLEAKGVYVEILNMPLLNTNNENEFVRELLQPTALNLLAYFAQKEIELKKERQTGAYAALPVDEKGRKLSIKKNKVVGRPNKQENLSQEQKRYIEAWIAGNIKTKDCIKATGIGKSTLFVIKKNIIGGGV
jgi:DNA invertase Pin-like site-specific DNA recombinase